MSSRPQRRRRERARGDGGAPPPRSPLPGRTSLIAIAFLAVGAIVVVFALLLLLGGDGGDDGDDGATLPAGDAFSPANEDEARLVELARQSIESIPAGTWPDLYDEFTAGFQARCPREEFAQAGVESAQGLGDDLTLLRFVQLQGVLITGDTATATIVGSVREEYQVQVAYEREDGIWKLAPASGTQGCQSFNRLNAG